MQSTNSKIISNREDIFKYWRESSFSNLELLTASYKDHSYPRHFHETYVVQVIESGVNQFYCNGRNNTVTPGTVVVINPTDVHTGSCISQNHLTYRAFYPSVKLMEELAGKLCEKNNQAPVFMENVYEAPDLYNMILKAHKTVEESNSTLQSQSDLTTTLCELIQRFSCNSHRSTNDCIDHPAISKVCEYLQFNYSDKIYLQDLADLAGLSPYHLLRTFKKSTNLTPNEYLVNLRIEYAKTQLKQKCTLTQVALNNGFCDQSHFIRNFRRLIGMTPGQYIKSIN